MYDFDFVNKIQLMSLMRCDLFTKIKSENLLNQFHLQDCCFGTQLDLQEKKIIIIIINVVVLMSEPCYGNYCFEWCLF